MFLRSIHVVVYNRISSFFWIIFNCVEFCYSFIFDEHVLLLPPFGYWKECLYEHCYTSISLSLRFQFFCVCTYKWNFWIIWNSMFSFLWTSLFRDKWLKERLFLQKCPQFMKFEVIFTVIACFLSISGKLLETCIWICFLPELYSPKYFWILLLIQGQIVVSRKVTFSPTFYYKKFRTQNKVLLSDY